LEFPVLDIYFLSILQIPTMALENNNSTAITLFKKYKKIPKALKSLV